MTIKRLHLPIRQLQLHPVPNSSVPRNNLDHSDHCLLPIKINSKPSFLNIPP